MEEDKQPGTIGKIRKIVEEWQAERMGSRYAMREIDVVLAAAELREERLKTISEYAKRDRKLRDREPRWVPGGE